ncbi:hypothetical protein NQ318_007556 [Aromia moschata]|uniref:Gag-pol polyprotein n=1 Tax=Aromia moschata TaxID=1265417 RepID=A0AAV8YE57_9CUCU|nr:hypothetical protein NQ318_007556 [Aromia moschata]
MLWEEILRRTQGTQEKVVNFVAVMENLFRKLPQLDIHDNPSQPYKTRAIEETEMRVQRFAPPPISYRTLLESEMAYRRVFTQEPTYLNAVRGMDFWRIMKIIPDMFSGSWSFRDSQEVNTPKILAINSADTLTSLQKDQLTVLTDSAFRAMGTKLGCITLVEHVIQTDSPPIKQRHYPISPALQKQVYEELEKMLADGVVEPSSSAWSSPILLIKKDDGRYRFVVEFDLG